MRTWVLLTLGADPGPVRRHESRSPSDRRPRCEPLRLRVKTWSLFDRERLAARQSAPAVVTKPRLLSVPSLSPTKARSCYCSHVTPQTVANVWGRRA
jgi:hypothetical protein